MDELMEECRKLNSMLKSSREYKSYISAKNHLRRNEDLEKKLRELYARNREETKKLYEENDELLHNSLVNDYIVAESALRRLLKTMLDMTAADIMFNFLDEGI